MPLANCIPKELIENLKKQVLEGKITPEQVANMLPTEKAALKAILEEFVADKLGVSVSKGEVTEIQALSKKIDEAQVKLGAELGNPAKTQENIDFFAAKKGMDNYLLSKHPANKLKVLTGTIGRGMMLFSVKSPALNIGSNIEIGFSEALSRRIAGGVFKGTDSKLAVDYVKMVNKIYQKTGYDVSRMTTLKDSGVGGERVLGQTVHAQGPGAIRAVGRAVEDIVFKQMMGAPDVAFSSAHFADSVNLNALKIAKGDVVRAKEIMTDSMRIEPQTVEGELLRTQGILDAQKATWTDTSWASRVSEGIRKILNDVSGDARAGDYLLPFIKTPANVIATGMDYAGMGVPKALIKTVRAIRSGEIGSREYFQGISRDLVRSGLGITAAVIITSQLSNDDFVGAYDPARAQIEALRNSNTNSVNIGGKWISTDWFGPLAVPITAMMYARKYGKTGGEKTFQYATGVLSAALNIPGVADIYDTVRTQAYKQNQSLEEMSGSTLDYVTTEAYSRLVPSFFSDVAKAIDPNVRQGGKGLQGIEAKIPFLSQTLPEKLDIFGQPIIGEGAVSDILFGSRVKTDKETSLVKELSRVSTETDKSISFTDWAKSSSKTLTQFKETVGGVKYDEAKVLYGQELKGLLEKLVSSGSYVKASNEEKLKQINSKDTEAMNKIFKKYGFKYKSK